MNYKRYGDDIVLRLDSGDEITESILAAAKKENVKCADISGIGATDDFTVGVFDLTKKEYEKFHFTGNHEIVSLCGNLTEMDGEKYSHLHISCADKNGNVKGGHLISAVISLTCEIFIHLNNGNVYRKYDKTSGINKIEFI